MATTPATPERADRDPMDFAEFGDEFARLVLVPEVIGPRLEALLPKAIKVTEQIAVVRASVRGSATVGSIEAVEQGADEMSTVRRHRAMVELNLSLRLNLAVKKESYTVTGRFPLMLTSRVERPLALVVEVETPDPADIEVETDGGGKLNLAERVGNLDDRIRGHVIAIIEDMVAKTEMHRRFDVVELVHTALAAMGEPNLGEDGTYSLQVDADLNHDRPVIDEMPVGGAAVG